MLKLIIVAQREFLEDDCKCKEKGLFAFSKALNDTGVWPFDEKNRFIDTIANGLKSFSYKPPSDDCEVCSQSFKIDIYKVAGLANNYFQGLCLDCMSTSRKKSGTLDTDYWRHNGGRFGLRPGVPWDNMCRFKHDRNTWYHSYMARCEKNADQKAMEDRRWKEAVGMSNANSTQVRGALARPGGPSNKIPRKREREESQEPEQPSKRGHFEGDENDNEDEATPAATSEGA